MLYRCPHALLHPHIYTLSLELEQLPRRPLIVNRAFSWLKAPRRSFTFPVPSRGLLRDCEALVVTDTRHRNSSSGLLGPRLALQPDAHVVGVPLLTPVAEAGVELGHGVRAVEGHLEG